MRTLAGYLLATIVVVVASTPAYAADSMTSSSMSSAKPVIFTPSAIKWTPGSGQIPATVGVAVLDGDPSKAGPFTLRLKIPAGTKFTVHYHDDTERVTVISGTFMAAIGTKFDVSKLMTLPAGSFVVIPGGVRHFAMAKVDAIVQVSGLGPFAMKMDKK